MNKRQRKKDQKKRGFRIARTPQCKTLKGIERTVSVHFQGIGGQDLVMEIPMRVSPQVVMYG